MSKDGNKIPDLSVERVREQLADERDPKAIGRVAKSSSTTSGV